MDAIETFKVGNKTVKLCVDEEPESPREWSNVGTMICFHKRYRLGDYKGQHGYDWRDYGGWDALRAAIEEREDAAVILPLYLYDHSGITMNTTGFACPWDSGQVGFIFVSKKKVREEFGGRLTKRALERARQALIQEVQTYDEFLTGQVYGFVIEDENGDEVDSCWGFYGLDYARQEAREAAAA